MNLVLLSGGSGKRLWPLSNEARSKQFIRIFRTDNGYESMAQRVYRQLRAVDPDARITVATSLNQVSAIRNQLGDGVDICVEPCRRDTFPAVALACLYLRDVKGIGGSEPVVVCPVDPLVENAWFEALPSLAELVRKNEANLSLIGIEPTFPSEKYGYIIPETAGPVSKVLAFKEKPDTETARGYLTRGGLWNGGVFAFRIDYMADRVKELTGYSDYASLLEHYAELEKISFDYAVSEKEKNIRVVRYSGTWMDLGTWNTLIEAMDENTVGEVVTGEDCENVHVINDLNLPLICTGVRDLIVAAGPDGILVSGIDASARIKPYVDRLNEPVRYAEKSWGKYTVLDMGENSLTVKAELEAGHALQYHSHEHRNETWSVLAGEGVATVDGKDVPLSAGSVLALPLGCAHTVRAVTDLTIIEVQTGDLIDKSDKTKLQEDKNQP